MSEVLISQKRRPKNPIKFKIQLNEEQKKAKEIILSNTLTLLAGSAGSGKTFLACQVALDGLFSRRYERIIITRPTVSKEDIGFLPGALREKMDPGNWELRLGGSGSLQQDKLLQLIDDSSTNTNPNSGELGVEFNIVSGSTAAGVETAADSETTHGSYGFFYPEVGILILNPTQTLFPKIVVLMMTAWSLIICLTICTRRRHSSRVKMDLSRSTLRRTISAFLPPLL